MKSVYLLFLPLLLVSCAEFRAATEPAKTEAPPVSRAYIEVILSRNPGTGGGLFAAEPFGEEPPSPDPKVSPPPRLTSALTQANAIQLFLSQLKDPSLMKGLAFQAEWKDPLAEERSKRATRMAERGAGPPPPDKPGLPRKPPSLYFAGIEARDKKALLEARGGEEIAALTCGPPDGDRRILSLSGFLSAAAKRMVEFLKERGETRISLLSSPTPYGERGRTLFREAARERGLEILSEETLKVDSPDLRLPPERDIPLVIWAEGKWAISLVRALRNVSYRGLLLFGPAVPHPDLTYDAFIPWSFDLFLKEAGGAAEGVLAVAHRLLVAEALPRADPQRFPLRKFWEEYETQFGSPPSLLSACTYDAFLFAAENLRALAHPLDLPTLPPRLLQRLLSAPSWSGVLGTYTFRTEASGERRGMLGPEAFILVRAEGGRWRPAR